MKIILLMAISVNGMIASRDGNEDFLSHTNWIQFVKLANKAGCFIYGRNTYEAVKEWEGDYLTDLDRVKKIVISSKNINVEEGFILKHSPEEAIEYLKAGGFKEVIVAGGATINSEFARKGLIDEIIFYVNPIILGEGIGIFRSLDFVLDLKLLAIEKLDDEIIELHYKVENKKS